MLDFWRKLFPNAQINQSPIGLENEFTIQLDTTNWIHIPSTQLSERELSLIHALQSQTTTPAQDPQTAWYEYVTKQHAEMPVDLDRIQFVFVRLTPHSQHFFAVNEWITVMKTFFVNVIDLFQSNDTYIFILDQSHNTNHYSHLAQTIATIEDDFACRMRIFIGHTWRTTIVNIPELFQAEKELFEHYLQQSNKQSLIFFSDLLLWALPHAFTVNQTLFSAIHQLLPTQEDAHLMIEAMWLERGTLTKAAQRAYVHRNTLQYRIDRFKDSTGFALKQMNDLALCYIALYYEQF